MMQTPLPAVGDRAEDSSRVAIEPTNNGLVQNRITPATTEIINIVDFERKQRKLLRISSYILILFLFLVSASLTWYFIFIIVNNCQSKKENRSEKTIASLYGWPLWILLAFLTLFLISLLIFIHRYIIHSRAVSKKFLMSQQLRVIDERSQDVESLSTVSIATEKPADPSTIALAEALPLKVLVVEPQNDGQVSASC